MFFQRSWLSPVLLWTALMAFGLSGGLAWGAEENPEKYPQSLHLELAIGVDFFAQDVPQLGVQTTLQKGNWQFMSEASRNLLGQTPSYEFRMQGKLRIDAATLGAGLSWSQDSGFAAELDFAWAQPPQQARLRGQITSQGMSWTFDGKFKWDQLSVQLDQLSLSGGQIEIRKQAVLTWTPASGVTLRVRADRSGLKPLMVSVKREVSEGVNLTISGQLVGEDRLKLSEWGLALSEGPLEAGVELAPAGEWKEVWMEGSHSLEAGSWQGRISFGPQGWRKFHSEGDLMISSMDSFQGELDLDAKGWNLLLGVQRATEAGTSLLGEIHVGSREWGVRAESQLSSELGSLQGKLDWGSQGGELTLLGDVYLQEHSLQGSLRYSESSWSLDLLGSLALGEAWELSGGLSWFSGVWDNGNLTVTRTIEL